MRGRSRKNFFALVASAIVIAALIPKPARAQSEAARSKLVVSTEWLAQHLTDPNLVLLQVGERNQFARQHLPGAQFISLNDISEPMNHEKPGTLMLQMLSADKLRDRLAALGISDNSRIIVYYGNDWVTPATRVVFTLDYAGLGANTSVLDGGMQQWIKENRPVTAEVSAPKQGSLSPLRTRPIIVDAEWVKTNLGKPGISVVDGRAAAFYDGVETGGGGNAKHKTGHIAGAKSVPFTEITDDNLKFKSPAQLAALFAKAGVKPGDTVVGYCHIGQQATGMLFAARTLGYKVLLYDGSFEDWSAHADYPVETGGAKP